MEMKEITGQKEKKEPVIKKKVSSYEHDLKIEINKLVKKAKDEGIPTFFIYYSPEDGYVYHGCLPEEIVNKDVDVSSEYQKFYEFLRVCIGYNKDEFLKSEVIKTYG